MFFNSFEAIRKLLTQILIFFKILALSLKANLAINLRKKRIIFVFLIGFLLPSLFFFVPNTKHSFQKNFIPSIYLPQIKPVKYNFANADTYKGLPVGEVKTYNVDNAKGTVIFIPQYHKNPGSSSLEQKNDSAEIAQGQIYKILSFLIDKPKVNLVMTEGDLFGEVPAEKIGFIAKKITDRNTLVSLCQRLENIFEKESINPALEKKLVGDLHQEHYRVDREVILKGAPLKLKAEGKNIALFGSENKETQEESRVLVRNYIYLQDRKDELDNLSRRDGDSAILFENKNEMFEGLLKLLNGDKIDEEFAELEFQASSLGKEKVVGLLKKTEEVVNNLKKSSEENNTSFLRTFSNTPSRENNPYRDIKSRREIERLISKAESKIEEVVVKKRNQETAYNFATALKTENKSVGILQFGAGHEDGLIKELNKQGLSVVVIKVDEVVNRVN